MILSTGNLREPRFDHPWYTHLYSILNSITPRHRESAHHKTFT